MINPNDQIIQWARDAGFDVNFDIMGVTAHDGFINKELQAFATLIRNATLEEATVKCDALAAGQCLYSDGSGLTGDEGGTPFCQKQKEIERLRSENAELRKDAERYRFMRSATISMGQHSQVITAVDDLCDEQMDAAIDAAMKEQT